MARNQTHYSTKHNIFALNRVKKQCYYQPIRVDFSPIQKPNNQSQSIIPFFNHDHNYFTPAFILKRQKISLLDNLHSQKIKFEARINLTQKPTQHHTPQYKPTDSKYCQLCHQYFEDYWQHINDKYHKRMINSSKFNKDIIALCQTFQTQEIIENPSKTKKIQKEKVNKKITKTRDLKESQKHSKQNEIKQSSQQLKYPIKQLKQKQAIEIQNNQKKNLEQSLKIMLQLGNYSTNLISSNTFKQLCGG